MFADLNGSRRLVRLAACLAVAAWPTAAMADRHCSFARESAFYARDIAAEAMKARPADCPAKMTEAISRLRESMELLDICSCDPAQTPLRRWLSSHPSLDADAVSDCKGAAAAVNAIAREVLKQVEKCF